MSDNVSGFSFIFVIMAVVIVGVAGTALIMYPDLFLTLWPAS
jgi:Tfp pilus assembly protein PilV